MLVKTTLKNGETIIVTVDDSKQDNEDEYRDMSTQLAKLKETGRDLFTDAMSTIESCAINTVNALKEFGDAAKPDEFELTLGIELNAEVGAVLAKVGGSANIEVKLIWKKVN